MSRKLLTTLALALLAPVTFGQDAKDGAETRLTEKRAEVRKALAELAAVTKSLEAVRKEIEAIGASDVAKTASIEKLIEEIRTEIATIQRLGSVAMKLREPIVGLKAAEMPRVVVTLPVLPAEEPEPVIEVVEEVEELEFLGPDATEPTIEDVPVRVVEIVELGEPKGPRAFLGVNLEEHEGDGVRITGTVAGSPAQAAKLREGDVILSVGGKPVKSVDELAGLISSRRPGERVDLAMRRGDERFVYVIALGDRAEILARAERETAEGARAEEEAEAKRRRAEMKALPRADGGPMAAIEHALLEQRREREELTRHLYELGGKLEKTVDQAHHALKARQYREAAELSAAAQRVAQEREKAGARIEMIQRRLHELELTRERAHAYARTADAKRAHDEERAAAERREAAAKHEETAKQKRPHGGIEDRVGRLEERLARIEKLLEKLADR